jgi:hypothetical protein
MKHQEDPPPLKAAKASEAESIVYNSVERMFFDRASRDMTSDGFLGGAMLARNRLVAGGCNALRGLDAPGSKPARGGEGATFRLPSATEGGRFCLRAVVGAEAPGGRVEVSLAGKESPARFGPGSSISVPVPAGASVVGLALPGRWGGRMLRVAPASGERGTRIEVVAVFDFPPERRAPSAGGEIMAAGAP